MAPAVAIARMTMNGSRCAEVNPILNLGHSVRILGGNTLLNRFSEAFGRFMDRNGKKAHIFLGHRPH